MTPSPQAEADQAALPSLQRPWLILLLCALAAIPLLYPQVPPLIDLGGHLGRFAIQVDGGASPVLREWYSFEWDLVPNLGADLLIQILAPAMGLEPALKLIVIAAVVLQVAGYLLLARAVHGHVPPTALFALPFAYGLPFQYGFLNFSLASALATCALALWITLGNHDRPALRWVIFVPIGCAIWVCHLAGWALLCIFAGATELMRQFDRAKDLRATLLRSIAPLSCLLAPLLLKLLWPAEASGQGPTGMWFRIQNKLGFVGQALRDRWLVWDLASVIVIAFLILWAWRSPHFAKHRGLVLGVGITTALFLLMPQFLLGSNFADMRLLPTILAMALVAVYPRRGCPKRIVTALAIGGLIFTGARFAGNGISLALAERQFSRDLAVLDAIPRNSQLVSLFVGRCPEAASWALERRTHLAGYALARRHAFANDQWFIPGGQLLDVHNPDAGRFTGDPSQLTYETACPDKAGVTDTVAQIPLTMPYLWIVREGVPHAFPGWHAVKVVGGSAVYKRDHRTSTPQKSGGQ